MNLRAKTLSRHEFWLFTTVYLVVSLAAFVLIIGGGYSSILFLLYLGPFYLAVWVVMTAIAIFSRQVRYSPWLLYLILFIQTLTILFGIPDGGYYGISCRTKNIIQGFFDQSTCGGLWVNQQTYLGILGLYALCVVIFGLDVLRLRWLAATGDR